MAFCRRIAWAGFLSVVLFSLCYWYSTFSCQCWCIETPGVQLCLLPNAKGHYGSDPGGSEVKNQPAMQELQDTQVQTTGQVIPWRMAWHSSILAWNLMGRGVWWAVVHRVAKSQTQLK